MYRLLLEITIRFVDTHVNVSIYFSVIRGQTHERPQHDDSVPSQGFYGVWLYCSMVLLSTFQIRLTGMQTQEKGGVIV